MDYQGKRLYGVPRSVRATLALETVVFEVKRVGI